MSPLPRQDRLEALAGQDQAGEALFTTHVAGANWSIEICC